MAIIHAIDVIQGLRVALRKRPFAMRRRNMSRYPLAHVSHRIIDCAMRVHRRLGPGLLETAYRACLVRQLGLAGLECAFEVPIPIDYEGVQIGCAYRADVIVQQSILLELKAVDKLLPIHHAQVLTYLRLSRLPVGLLLNFNVARLKDGIHRFVL